MNDGGDIELVEMEMFSQYERNNYGISNDDDTEL